MINFSHTKGSQRFVIPFSIAYLYVKFHLPDKDVNALKVEESNRLAAITLASLPNILCGRVARSQPPA